MTVSVMDKKEKKKKQIWIEYVVGNFRQQFLRLCYGEYLRYDITHVHIGIGFIGIQYLFYLYDLVDQSKHPVILWIFQRFADSPLRENTDDHVYYRDHH